MSAYDPPVGVINKFHASREDRTAPRFCRYIFYISPPTPVENPEYAPDCSHPPSQAETVSAHDLSVI